MGDSRFDSGTTCRLAVGALLATASPGVTAGALVTIRGLLPGLWPSPFGDGLGFVLWALASVSSGAGGYLLGLASTRRPVRFAAAFAGLGFGATAYLLAVATLWANLFGT